MLLFTDSDMRDSTERVFGNICVINTPTWVDANIS